MNLLANQVIIFLAESTKIYILLQQMNSDFRRSTRNVFVGQVGVGSMHPVRIQSMLISETTQVEDVMREIKALNTAGCELIRITIPNVKALDTIPEIRQRMELEGIKLPLIADIHFNPKLAIEACELFEKVRINPGNYADRKKFERREYSDQQYSEELERVESSLLPLINNLKSYGRALRVGTNHGSLSDRVMNRYGDTARGMVQSAMEFLRILERHQFYDTILSMKSSNPLMMKEAYHLLVKYMDLENMEYPLHLGVTEAGNGAEGRIKSALGIGGLLCQGIGDTIRVSLTEPSENEIPVAKAILKDIDYIPLSKPEVFETWKNFSHISSKLKKTSGTGIYIDDGCRVGDDESFKLIALNNSKNIKLKNNVFDAFLAPEAISERGPIQCVPLRVFQSEIISQQKPDHPTQLLLLKSENLLVEVTQSNFLQLTKKNNTLLGYLLPNLKSIESSLGLAAQLGELITSGILCCIVCQNPGPDSIDTEFAQILLQATRVRIYRTDFISCPSCGRTFFDLQETTAAIKKRTAHLKGLKIAVMGCVVNGPGEMADADYGYIGAGPGQVQLYRGKECVERNIPSRNAVERLVMLIKKDGKWTETKKNRVT